MSDVASTKVTWLVRGTLALAILVLATAVLFPRQGRGTRPPDSPLPILGRVTDFTLTNQSGELQTAADLRGRIWLADIIFTRCPGPCVRMTRLMSEIQAALPASAPVRFVSLTADPAHDSPGVLKSYAERFGADLTRWCFLTGPKAELYRLAMKDLLLAVGEGEPEDAHDLENLFIHSTRFILVDQHGALRGSYDGEDPTSKAQILAAIESLLQAPPTATPAR